MTAWAQLSFVKGRFVLSATCYSKHRDACAVVLDVFAHLSMESSCMQVDAQTGFFWTQNDTLALQKLARESQLWLVMLAARVDPHLDLPLCSMGSS